MGQDRITQLLHQGVAAARSGQSDVARSTLQQVVREDPQNEIAWMWLSSVAVDDSERVFCLKKLLEINPQHEFAIKGLRALGIEPTRRSEAGTSGTTVPIIDDAKYSRVLQSVDDFLRRYNPEPVDRFDIQWMRKRRGRYGETSAQRLRQVALAATALVVLAAVIGVVFLVSQLGVFGEEGLPIGRVNTRVPSLTPMPTLTPTVGGPTPTPFPEPLVIEPTSAPRNLPKGDPYRLASPTAIYPRVNSNVARLVEEAVNYYSIGDYTKALDLLEQERGRSNPHCYVSLVYYEALSRAALGRYQEGLDLLDWARTTEPPRGYTSCQNEPLILVGFAEVAYMQDHSSDDALTFSEQALAADPKLTDAVLIKARVEMGRGQLDEARNTVTQALLNAPQDTNLLVLAAQIDLASDQPASALEKVGQALYMEPALLPALSLQTESYLSLAEQSRDAQRATVYYGLSVISAQTLLLYYAGDSAGYLYLAKARLGEGNTIFAETALSRILDAAPSLPESAHSTIQEAYRLRGDLRLSQGRFEAAKADLERVAYDDEGNLDTHIIEKLVSMALTLGDYSEADSWLRQLVAADSSNAMYRLWQVKVLVEICTFYPDQVTCRYNDMLQKLPDSFVNSLSSDAERAEALSYRAQAQYRDTMLRGGVGSAGGQPVTLQLALNDVTQAL